MNEDLSEWMVSESIIGFSTCKALAWKDIEEYVDGE